jgi:hypothetical protein
MEPAPLSAEYRLYCSRSFAATLLKNDVPTDALNEAPKAWGIVRKNRPELLIRKPFDPDAAVKAAVDRTVVVPKTYESIPSGTRAYLSRSAVQRGASSGGSMEQRNR